MGDKDKCILAYCLYLVNDMGLGSGSLYITSFWRNVPLDLPWWSQWLPLVLKPERQECRLALCLICFIPLSKFLGKSLQLEEQKKWKVKSLTCIWLFATPWTVAYQASPSMGFSRQEYWSGLPFPSPGDLPDPGIKPHFLHCRQILYDWATWEAPYCIRAHLNGLILT